MNKQRTFFMAVLISALLMLSQGALAWGGGSSYGDSSRDGSSDGGWTAADCRSCHDDHENLPLKLANPDNHHKLLGTAVRHSTAPEANLSDHYLCMSCHLYDSASQMYLVERDCLQCHKVNTVANSYSGNRHHDTQTARSRRCSTCHSRMPGGRSSGWGGR